MNDNPEKFIFLGVMLALAFLGGAWRGNLSALLSQNLVSGQTASALSGVTNEAGNNSAPVPAAVTPSEVAAPAPAALGVAPQPFRRASAAQPDAFQAEIGAVADLATGELYFDHQADRRWPIASITKLMTAAFAVSHMKTSEQVTLQAQDFLIGGGDLYKALQVNDRYSAEDLVRAMLIFSSNEAAEALTNAYGRTEFLAGLNDLAREWQMADTHFADPTGLSSANQSTAHDLIFAARHLYREHPELLQITRTPKTTITELNNGQSLVIQNINSFAGKPDFVGGKTGFTDEAQGNLLSIFKYDGRPIVVVVLGSADRFGEAQKLYDWFKTDFAPNPS